MDHELISVMIPCYNSAHTLGRALSSLVAQDYKNWEALVIDDGSTDHPEKVIAKVGDSRIRLRRLERNGGRACARQAALDDARGEFLTMLDADDLITPYKLSKQLKVMRDHPDVALVSTSMFMANNDGELVGVLRYGSSPSGLTILPNLNTPRPLPVAHAPILARLSLLRGRKYDSSLNYSEDLDFFLPVLLNHSYAVLSEPLYIYFFESNRSLKKISAQLASHRRIFAKYLKSHTAIAVLRIASTFLKLGLYAVLFAVKQESRLTYRNISAPSAAESLIYRSKEIN